MIAARTERRGIVGFLLLHRIDATDRHPNVMLAGLAATLILGCCLQGLLP